MTATAPAQATPTATAMLSSPHGPPTGSPASATALLTSSTQPLLSGEHAFTVCLFADNKTLHHCMAAALHGIAFVVLFHVNLFLAL